MKYLVMILSVFLLFTNGFWLYQLLDQAVTLKYRNQLLWECSRRVVVLSGLCDHYLEGKPASEARELLEKHDGGNIFIKKGRLNAYWLSLVSVLTLCVIPFSLAAENFPTKIR
jgi:hypothetical protein